MGFEEVTIGTCRLILGDALEVLPTLGPVNAVVTDPPYGIDFHYASHDDTSIGYGPWLWSILEYAERLCTPGAPIFVFQAMPNVRHFATWFPRDFRLYAAAKNFVQMRPLVAMQYAYDPIVCWWTPGDIWYNGKEGLPYVNRDFFVANTAIQISQPHNLERQHPCPRPLDQMHRLIEAWVRPGTIALDPFMGSGTTGVACVQLGRSFVGVEIDEHYWQIACRRIEAAYAQPDLFAPPLIPPTQEVLL
jgi:DNA modification methylase